MYDTQRGRANKLPKILEIDKSSNGTKNYIKRLIFDRPNYQKVDHDQKRMYAREARRKSSVPKKLFSPTNYLTNVVTKLTKLLSYLELTVCKKISFWVFVSNCVWIFQMNI